MSEPARVDRRRLLQNITIFEGIDGRDLDALVEIATTKRLRAREVLIRKGAENRQLYGVMSGRLRILGESEEGKEIVFSITNPGEVIGEISVLDSYPVSATAEAIEPCELLTLHRRDLNPFLENHPKVAIKLAQLLAGRVRRLSELVEDTLFLTLPSRLAKKLIGLAQMYGKETPTGVLIELRLSQHELGELVGATRESINKQMRAWASEGLVRFNHGYITISESEGLESLARYLIP